MNEILGLGNTVNTALHQIYDIVMKNREVSFARINGLLFVVFPEEEIVYPNLSKTETSALKDELEKRGLVTIKKENMVGLDKKEVERFIQNQNAELRYLLLEKTKRPVKTKLKLKGG